MTSQALEGWEQANRQLWYGGGLVSEELKGRSLFLTLPCQWCAFHRPTGCPPQCVSIVAEPGKTLSQRAAMGRNDSGAQSDVTELQTTLLRNPFD